MGKKVNSRGKTTDKKITLFKKDYFLNKVMSQSITIVNAEFFISLKYPFLWVSLKDVKYFKENNQRLEWEADKRNSPIKYSNFPSLIYFIRGYRPLIKFIEKGKIYYQEPMSFFNFLKIKKRWTIV